MEWYWVVLSVFGLILLMSLVGNVFTLVRQATIIAEALTVLGRCAVAQHYRASRAPAEPTDESPPFQGFKQ